MDFKLDYITKFLYKIKNKKIESYVISRLWHRLNDDRVKFVFQQYVKRDDEKYALADLYLPQINMIIEVNESYHLNNIEVDKIRNIEVANNANSDVYVIDCSSGLEVIHQQIDEIIIEIQNRIEKQGNKFRPWQGEDTLTVDYHKNKGYLLVDDDEYIKTIDDACAIFGAIPKHKGYLRVAGAPIPSKNNWHVWCPKTGHKIWHNIISEDRCTILEYKKDDSKRTEHVTLETNNNQVRVTFLREKDNLGFVFFKFVGVFRLDIERSHKDNMCVWVRISDRYDLID